MIGTLIGIGVMQALVIVLSFSRAKLVAVGLGPEGLGIVGTIDQMLVVVLQISVVSLPTVALKFLSRAHSDGPDAFRHTYASFFKALLGLSIAGAALTIAVVTLSPGLLGPELANQRWAITIALCTVPGTAVGLLLSNVLASSQRPLGAAIVQCGVAAAAASAAAIGLSFGAIWEIYLAGLILSVALLVAVVVYLHNVLHLPFFDRSTSIRRELERSPGIVPSALMAYAALSVYSLALLAPRYAALRSMGAESAGLLQSLLSLSAAIGALLAAMNSQYLMPMLNRRSSVDDKLAVAATFQHRQLLLLAVASAPLVFFPEAALSILFSRQFVSAAPWLATFLVWQVLIVQASVLQQVLFSIDALRTMVVMTCVGYGLAVVLCFLLAPLLGLGGIAVALLSGTGIVVLGAAYTIRRQYGFAVRGRLLGLTAYVVGALLVGGWLAVNVGLDTSALALRGTLAVLFVGGLFFFLDVSEFTDLTGILQRVRSTLAGARSR